MPVPGPVVDVEWLAAARAGERPPVVADVRWYLPVPGGQARSGHEAYLNGHIPSAVFVDLDGDLAGPPGHTGRHPLPEPEAFATSMGRLGIADHDTVVGYDDVGGAVAARLWWMLHVTGHDAAVLDGGIAAWEGPLARGPGEVRPPAPFTARPWPGDALVDADGVATALEAGAVVLDARARERFRGDVEPVDPRAGHIPGAVNAPSADALGADGRFLSGSDLRARFEALGVRDKADVIAYCGSGVTACHALLTLAVAGCGPGRLYPGSWSEWCADGRRPVAVGE